MAAAILTLLGQRLNILISSIASPLGAVAMATRGVTDLLQTLDRAPDARPIVIIEPKLLKKADFLSAAVLRRIVAHKSSPRVIVIASDAEMLFPADQSWFTSTGVERAYANITATRWSTIGAPFAHTLAEMIGTELNRRRLDPVIRSLTLTENESSAAAAIAIARIESRGFSLGRVIDALGGAEGIEVTTHKYRMTHYPECFVAQNAVGWLANHHNISREHAVDLGRALQAAGLIYHVAREQLFADENFFFRLTRYPARFNWAVFLERFFSADGVEIRDRTYHAINYPRCFVGKHAADWMSKQGFAINESLSVGQRMMDLSIIHHVVDQHPFKVGDFFYRALRDEEPAPTRTTAPTVPAYARLAAER